MCLKNLIIKNPLYIIYCQYKSRHPIYNFFNTKYKRNALLLYITKPFTSKKINKFKHQNQIQAVIIAKAISRLGYNVDIVDFNNFNCKLNKKYDLIFDICPVDNAIYNNYMNNDCKRIAYFTGSESNYQNEKEKARINDLYNRKGYRLNLRRTAPIISNEVSRFDGVIIIGNKVTADTFNKYNFNKFFLVNNSGYNLRFDLSCNEKKSNYFLYLGSSGCVLKGLDLLLDIFSEDDLDCKLFVCGTFKNEKDFYAIYKNELTSSKNIVPIGYIDTSSKAFANLAKKCTYVIQPSCSEGQSGSITTAMSAGLIPICSKECGFDESDVHVLMDCNIVTIRNAIIKYSNKNHDWIVNESNRVFELSKIKYSEHNFINAINESLKKIILNY